MTTALPVYCVEITFLLNPFNTIHTPDREIKDMLL